MLQRQALKGNTSSAQALEHRDVDVVLVMANSEVVVGVGGAQLLVIADHDQVLTPRRQRRQ